MMAIIAEVNETTIEVRSDDGTRYDVMYDAVTGDWLVASEDDKLVQSPWMADRDSAVKYALKCAGVLDDVEYERAPERC